MFHLLTSLYTDITQRPRFNVLFLGSADSGKTTLLQVIKSHYIESKPLPSRLAPGQSTEQNKSLLPKTRSTVGQNVLDLPAPPPSSRPLVEPTHPPPILPDPQEVASSSAWFSSASKAPSTSKRIPSKALIHIWDLGGDLGLRKIWEKYYAETDAVVYLWDCEKGGNGEGREAEWSVVAELARDARLSTVPFLILLSRSDLISSSLSQSRRLFKAAAPHAATEREQQPAAEAQSSTKMEAVEEGDLSLSIEHAGQESLVKALEGRSEVTDTGGTPTASLRHNHRADGEARDLVESLRAFIQSNIEAKTRTVRKSPHAASVPKGLAPSILAAFDDAQDAPFTADETEASEALGESECSFPETTIFPMSILTGRGVEECMDWIVQKSLAAGRGDGEREGKIRQSVKK